MEQIIVKIEWDYPDKPNWLNADDVKLCLEAYYKNTKFRVTYAQINILYQQGVK